MQKVFSLSEKLTLAEVSENSDGKMYFLSFFYIGFVIYMIK